MIKLSKCYIAVMCAAVLVSGCGQAQQTMQDEPMTEVTQQQETDVFKEDALHPVMKNGIDYLSVEGIELETGTQIAMVATNSDNPYWDVVKAGAAKAVADLNASMGYFGKSKISLSFAAPQDEDVIEQINIIDQFLDKAPDALCVAFTDASASKTQMQMAKNNGIRLLAFDTPDDSFLTEGIIATDNKAAATEAAAKLYEAIDYEGKVAILVHNSLTKTGQERKQAIVDELAKNYNDKNIQFVDIVYLAQEDRSTEEIFAELLERTPDLAGIICTMAYNVAAGILRGIGDSKTPLFFLIFSSVLNIVLDRINGIDLDTIVEATNIINPILDEHDLIKEEYILDISSKERG